MTPALYDFHEGTTPLLLSIPHAGTHVPEALRDRWTEAAKEQEKKEGEFIADKVG